MHSTPKHQACCIHAHVSHTPCSWGDDGLEYDQNGPRQLLVDWIKGCDGVSTTFDFPTKGILQASSARTRCCLVCNVILHPCMLSMHSPAPSCHRRMGARLLPQQSVSRA